jgi:EAL domain-containing protein (putative c-di-GMP-specific phosphodiesterase class I)
LNVLLLAADPAWRSATLDAVEGIGTNGIAHVKVTETDQPADAVRQLIEHPDRFTHLLVNPTTAGQWLGDLLELTAGSVESHTEMVLLGAGRMTRPTVTVVDAATPSKILAALLANPATDRSNARVPLPELHNALADQAIQARYQPIVSLSDGSLFGVEVLARLRHPSRGTLPPDTFVPPMEDAGLWDKLLRAITASGFQGLARPGIADMTMVAAFNLPLPAVLQPQMLAELDDLRQQAGIPTERILIELTESHPVQDVPALAHALTLWRNAGYGVSIDDLSPEVANDRALLDLPFTVVKLDKSVVCNSADDRSAHDYLRDVVRIAHTNGMKIIAEGVRRPEDWVRTRDLGIDLTQSYLVSRPLPASAVPVWARLWAQTGAPELTGLPPPPAMPG